MAFRTGALGSDQALGQVIALQQRRIVAARQETSANTLGLTSAGWGTLATATDMTSLLGGNAGAV
jgi:hypothetical protein